MRTPYGGEAFEDSTNLGKVTLKMTVLGALR